MNTIGSNGPAQGLVHEAINISIRGVTVPVYSRRSQEAGMFRDSRSACYDI
jgi:hypothetical protein